MFYVEKRIEVAGAHFLALDYESKCSHIHGHNWIITIYCRSIHLNKNGMVIDFGHIKDVVMKLDHKVLNDLFNFNPTAENIAKYFVDNITHCYKATVIESENNKATYEL